MPTAYLTTYGLKASVRSERLEISAPRGEGGTLPERRWIPLADIEHLVVDAGVSLSSKSLCALLRKKIPVLFLAHGKLPSGIAVPLNRSVTVLADQLDACRDPDSRLRLARATVEAKILNQRRVLQRLAANRKEQAVGIPWLKAMARNAAHAESADSLRGFEGAATGRYFELLGAYFPPDLPFERRSRRPPLNPPNALLSFVYTLLCSEFALYLRACGLEPGWGFLHEAEDGRPALALDLIEPFRAPVADALALDLLNHRRLKADDFEREGQSCLLKQSSRRRLFAAYEERLQREFLYEKTGSRTTLRQLMKDACAQVKKAFANGAPIEPFNMN